MIPLFLLFALGVAPSVATIETRFDVPGLAGDPFDAERNDIRVSVRGPGGVVAVPAFFDGGVTWRVRFTPRRPGVWTVTGATRNGTPLAIAPTRFVLAPARPGFIGRDPSAPTRFRFDDGSRYYPIGHNVGWSGGGIPEIPVLFERMGGAGENWSRVWMCHWDGKNLDWTPGRDGGLNLEVARRWDGIVAAAQRHGIYFQMVLQHHGPYSSTVNSNWGENPWNAKNGGFLKTPEEFFTDPEARRRTRNKLRYAAARWGYSPAVMAWELFNEVEWTDGARKTPAAVAAWHREMAEALRRHDVHRHLVTTSSHGAGIYDAMDFLQPHAYPPDLLSAVTALAPANRPVFFGEIGPAGDLSADDGTKLKQALWSGLMTSRSGAPQYWAWDNVHRRDLYGLFAAATAFARRSGVTELPPATATIDSPVGGAASAGPGAGWASASRTSFPIQPDGVIEGIGAMPSFLQGEAHRPMFPAAEYPLTLERDGRFAVTIAQSARAGARLVVRVDGVTVAERDFPAAAQDTKQDVRIEVAVPAGVHTVRLENIGADWLVIGRVEAAPIGTAVRALVRSNGRQAALWLWRSTSDRAPAGGWGTVTLPKMAPGRYRATWWDTQKGTAVGTDAVVADGGALRLAIPPFADDIALIVAPENPPKR